MAKSIIVAAAFTDEYSVLSAQRSYPAHLAGQWEFPGGKVQSGETLLAALHRELWEELGWRFDPDNHLAIPQLQGQIVNPDPRAKDGMWPILEDRLMAVFWIPVRHRPQFSVHEHQSLIWVQRQPDQPDWLSNRNWLAPDLPIAQRIEQIFTQLPGR